MITIILLTAFVLFVSATAVFVIVALAFASIDDADEALRVFEYAVGCGLLSVLFWWLI